MSSFDSFTTDTSNFIILAAQKSKTCLYLSISHEKPLTLINTIHNKSSNNKVLKNYLEEISKSFLVLNSHFPTNKTIVIAEPDFLGYLRKKLIRERVNIYRTLLMDLSMHSEIDLSDFYQSMI